MVGQIIVGVILLLVVLVALYVYIALMERLVHLLPDKQRSKVRAWLWIGPTVLLLIVFLVYPALYTMYLSLFNSDSTQFVGLDNYIYAFTNQDMLGAIRNNIYWVLTFPTSTLTIGLLIAVLFDRVR